MAFCLNTMWDMCICNCDDSQSEHVHCGCKDCNGMPVSRATAFRHRKHGHNWSAAPNMAATSFKALILAFYFLAICYVESSGADILAVTET